MVSTVSNLLLSIFSLIEFFNKMKKWSDMANLPQEMRERLDLLERNFNVSAIIFGKLGKIFKHLFKSPILSPVKQASNRSRKQRLVFIAYAGLDQYYLFFISILLLLIKYNSYFFQEIEFNLWPCILFLLDSIRSR